MLFDRLKDAQSVEFTTRGTLNSTFISVSLLEYVPSVLSFFVTSTVSRARNVGSFVNGRGRTCC